MSKKKRQRYLVRIVPGDGDPCPRCRLPMQIREYNNLTDKRLHRPYFYTRWFCCMNKSCPTTLVMPERYKVMNPGFSGSSGMGDRGSGPGSRGTRTGPNLTAPRPSGYNEP